MMARLARRLKTEFTNVDMQRSPRPQRVQPKLSH